MSRLRPRPAATPPSPKTRGSDTRTQSGPPGTRARSNPRTRPSSPTHSSSRTRSSSPKRAATSRRRFLQILAAASVAPWARAALPAAAVLPAAALGVRPAGAQTGEKQETPQEVRTLLDIVKQRWGERLDAAQLRAIEDDLNWMHGAGKALRGLQLTNADEPDVVFRAEPPEVPR